MPDPTPPTPPADGNNPPAPPAPPPAPPAVDVNAAIATAIAQHDAAQAAKFKAATGFDSLEALTEDKLKKEGDYKGLAEAKAAEASAFKSRFEQTAVKAEILAGAGDALDAEVVHSLLSHKAIVDEKGVVTIDGKPVKEAVAQLLKDKPFLAKPSGNQGSGAPHNAGNTTAKTILRAEFEKMPAAQQMAFIKANGVVTE